MSLVPIRAALETELAAMSPALATAYENKTFTPPPPSVPYQEAFLLPAEPDSRESGPQFLEQGIFQVSLRYPLKKGSGPAVTRAEAIRATFWKARSLTSGGIVVNILRTPEIMKGQRDGDRWLVVVKIRWTAQVGG